MTTYTAIASRDERAWDFRVPGLGNHPEDDLHMQAPTGTAAVMTQDDNEQPTVADEAVTSPKRSVVIDTVKDQAQAL